MLLLLLLRFPRWPLRCSQFVYEPDPWVQWNPITPANTNSSGATCPLANNSSRLEPQSYDADHPHPLPTRAFPDFFVWPTVLYGLRRTNPVT